MNESRTLVLLRKDVAADNWHRSFDDLVAAAEAGDEGIKTMQQDKAGSGDARYWNLNIKFPSGWAAFRQGDGRYEQTAFLHIQNY